MQRHEYESGLQGPQTLISTSKNTNTQRCSYTQHTCTKTATHEYISINWELQFCSFVAHIAHMLEARTSAAGVASFHTV